MQCLCMYNAYAWLPVITRTSFTVNPMSSASHGSYLTFYQKLFCFKIRGTPRPQGPPTQGPQPLPPHLPSTIMSSSSYKYAEEHKQQQQQQQQHSGAGVAAPAQGTFEDVEAAPVKATFDNELDENAKRDFRLGLELVAAGDKDPFTFFRACFAEFLSTALFLFINITTISYLGYNNTVEDLPAAQRLFISLNFGFSIFVLVYAFGPISGGHINPAVTFCMTLGKRISLYRGVCYVAAQVVGATVGSAIAKAVSVQAAYDRSGGGVNIISPEVSTGDAFGGELIMTFLLCLIVLAATNDQLGHSASHMSTLLPYAIGIAVFLGHMVLVPIDGCSINPARSFGAAAVARDPESWHDMWLFWVAPLCGSALSLLTWESVLRPPIIESADDGKTV
jgi:aquaporin PIP